MKLSGSHDLSVLMLGWELPPFNSGGLGVACLGLAEGLADLNIRVNFVLPFKVNISSKKIKLFFASDADNIPSQLLSAYVNSSDVLQINKTSGLNLSLIERVKKYAADIKGIVEKTQFNVIHAHDWLTFPAGVYAKVISGKPLIVHIHATEFDRSGGDSINQEVYNIERTGMILADRVIVVSNYTKNILVEKYGINPSKIEIVYNGVNMNDYQYIESNRTLSAFKARGYKIVSFVGRLTLQKGPDYFIKVAKRVLGFNKKILFVVAGTGDMEHSLISLSADLGISQNIFFTGFLRGEELNMIYQMSDLFIMPSVSEPFGISTLEAIANGTPVLLSRQSGVSEVLSHALKSDFWDEEDMTDKIISSLQFKVLRDNLKDNSFMEVKKYSWEKAAFKCRDIYNNLLN